MEISSYGLLPRLIGRFSIFSFFEPSEMASKAFNFVNEAKLVS
jgi:hypothetical protein